MTSSNPSRSRANRRIGVEAVTVAVRGTSRSSATSPKYLPFPIAPTGDPSRTTSARPDATTKNRSPGSPWVMRTSPGLGGDPASVLEDHGELLRIQGAEDGELSELGERLHRVTEVRRPHVLGEEPVERSLVHLEQLDLVERPDGRLTAVGPEQSHLAERLAPLHRPEQPCVARLRVLVLDLHRAFPDHVEGIGLVALAEDRLARAEDPQVDAPGEIGQDVLRKVVEGGELVDQLRCLDTPVGLEAEPDRSDHASDAAQQDAGAG